MKKERRVRLISLHAKYVKYPFPCVPAFDPELDTYITGQHVEEGINSESDGLTKDEMRTGNLTVARKKKFPFVIDPMKIYPIIHMKTINLNDFKQRALFNLYLLQKEVAIKKDDYIRGKHFFYVEDLEKEAEVSVQNDEEMFKAITKVMNNTALNKLVELAMWLNHVVPKFKVATKRVSTTQLQKAIYDACKEYPKEVLQFYDKKSRDTMFVLKLNHYSILQRRDNAYWDETQFIGRTIADVLQWMHKDSNEQYLKMWSEMLSKYEGKAEATLGTGKLHKK